MFNFFTAKRNLHRREDGSSFLLDDANLELQTHAIEEIVKQYGEIAEILAKYQDTRERAKNPEYLREVLRSSSFIENDRTREIYDWLKASPLGEQAKAQFVAQTLDSIPGELFRDIDVVRNNMERNFRDLDKRLSPDDLLIALEEGSEFCSVKLREGYIEDLKASLIVEVSKEALKDVETFRKALGLLYSLAEKGYRVTKHLNGFFRQDLINNPEERKAALTDEELISKLRF